MANWVRTLTSSLQNDAHDGKSTGLSNARRHPCGGTSATIFESREQPPHSYVVLDVGTPDARDHPLRTSITSSLSLGTTARDSNLANEKGRPRDMTSGHKKRTSSCPVDKAKKGILPSALVFVSKRLSRRIHPADSKCQLANKPESVVRKLRMRRIARSAPCVYEKVRIAFATSFSSQTGIRRLGQPRSRRKRNRPQWS